MQARLLNRLSAFPDTYNLMGTAFEQGDGLLPVMMVHGLQSNDRTNHTLIQHQRSGIVVDRMLELFKAYNHDMDARG
jgi:hypothetical protein